MLERVLGSESEEEESTDNRMERETVKGILQDTNEEISEFMRDDDAESFVCRVNAEQLSKLSELECFVDDSISYKKSIDFASRWDSDVECFLTITDTEEVLQTRLNQVVATDISNSMIRDFSSTFRTEICTNFDPMGEEHEEPHLSISPF